MAATCGRSVGVRGHVQQAVLARCHTEPVEAQLVGVRAAADRDDHEVGLHLDVPVTVADVQDRVPVLAGAGRREHGDAQLVEPPGDRTGQRGVDFGQGPLGHLDQSHRRTEFCQCGAEFDPDVAGADDRHRGRQLGQVERSCAVQDVHAVGHRVGQHGRPRPGGDDDVAELHERRAARGRADHGLVRTREPEVPGEDPDPGAGQQRPDSPGQLADDAALVRLECTQVHRTLAGGQARRRVVGGPFRHVGHLDQGLGRDAARTQADPADAVLTVPVDHQDVATELGAAQRGRVPGRAAADDQELDGLGDLSAGRVLQRERAFAGARAEPGDLPGQAGHAAPAGVAQHRQARPGRAWRWSSRCGRGSRSPPAPTRR
jgi:hypothetical protein